MKWLEVCEHPGLQNLPQTVSDFWWTASITVSI